MSVASSTRSVTRSAFTPTNSLSEVRIYTIRLQSLFFFSDCIFCSNFIEHVFSCASICLCFSCCIRLCFFCIFANKKRGRELNLYTVLYSNWPKLKWISSFCKAYLFGSVFYYSIYSIKSDIGKYNWVGLYFIVYAYVMSDTVQQWTPRNPNTSGDYTTASRLYV